MTQAARRGRQNILEGCEWSATLKHTEMKLTDVARTSRSELRGDDKMFILDRGQLPWSGHSPEAGAIHEISIDDAPFKDDMVLGSAKHALQQRRIYAHWLDDDDAVVANAMLTIIGRALYMLKSQIAAQGRTFEKHGGFGERLMAKRIEARGQPKPRMTRIARTAASPCAGESPSKAISGDAPPSPIANTPGQHEKDSWKKSEWTALPARSIRSLKVAALNRARCRSRMPADNV